MPPTVTDEQPLEFLRWAPGLAAAWDAVRERDQEARQRAQDNSTQHQQGPRFNGGL